VPCTQKTARKRSKNRPDETISRIQKPSENRRAYISDHQMRTDASEALHEPLNSLCGPFDPPEDRCCCARAGYRGGAFGISARTNSEFTQTAQTQVMKAGKPVVITSCRPRGPLRASFSAPARRPPSGGFFVAGAAPPNPAERTKIRTPCLIPAHGPEPAPARRLLALRRARPAAAALKTPRECRPAPAITALRVFRRAHPADRAIRHDRCPSTHLSLHPTDAAQAEFGDHVRHQPPHRPPV